MSELRKSLFSKISQQPEWSFVNFFNAPRMICAAIFWICCPPLFMTCFMRASTILSISFEVWLISLGASMYGPFTAWLTVSHPAYTKSYLFKNPLCCRLLAFLLLYLAYLCHFLWYFVLAVVLIFASNCFFGFRKANL